jgi:hypothetical protein
MAEQETPHDPEALTGDAEPWESWETSLVLWSIGLGLAGLVVLGWLVSRFILAPA